MKIFPARAAAFDILLRVETTDAYASELLHSTRVAKLSPADHGLTTEIVMGVLRWRSVLDEQIAAHIAHPLTKLDAEVILALRIGTYQLLFLDRIPAHAAINESVELVKKAKKRSAAGMVNAVLRKITPSAAKAAADSAMPSARLKDGPSQNSSQARAPQPPPNFPTLSSRAEHDLSLAKDHAKSRDLHFSAQDDNAVRAHPGWLVERWTRNYGPETAQKICAHGQETPSTIIRANAALANELAQEGIELSSGRILSNARVVVHADVTRAKAFRERRVVIQDEGSQLVALLLGKGKRILDCCAAPGGKTRILAETNPDATVLAMELHPHRAALLKRLVPLPNVQVIAGDMRSMPFAEPFDRILVDAPCTGTGTLARNPEIKWRIRPEDITRLQAYQIEILSAVVRQLSPRGQLLYSTCSLEPEENEAAVDHVLCDNAGFRVLDIRDRLEQLRGETALAWPDVGSLVSGPYLRTIPGVHPCDGFFAALLEREL